MPRITVVTNRCNGCGATHRPKPEEDDADRLEDGTEDTELPVYWVASVLRAKQPNPDFHKNEKRVHREVQQQWAMAVQQATAASGKPLDADDLEGLKQILEKQARGDQEFPELVVQEEEALWCPNCVAKLPYLGVALTDLSAVPGKIPSAWVPAAAPAPATVVPMVPPPVVAAPPAPQPSPPPLSVVPQAEPSTPTEPPSAA